MTTHYVHAIKKPFARLAVSTKKSRETVYSFEHPSATLEELRKYVADHVVLQIEPYENTFPATDDGAAEAFIWLEALGGNVVGVALLPTPA